MVEVRSGERNRSPAARITDHVRACTFAIHEEVYPAAEKQKYVVRRLFAAAVLDGHQMGVRDPFLYKLVPVVAEMMKVPYPELGQTTERVAGVIQAEEAGFLGKIDAGLDRIQRLFDGLKKESSSVIAGRDAAELYTTHGFPPELLETLAAEHNLTFDWDGYRQAMEKHGKDSGAGNRKELFKTGPLDPLKKVLNGTEFLGYEQTEAEGKIVGLVAGEQLVEMVDEIGHAEPIQVLLDRTPFYGESGGQVGDTGELVAPGVLFEVIDTRKEDGFTLHVGHLRSGQLQLGRPSDSPCRRRPSRRHPPSPLSATHILHYACRSTSARMPSSRARKWTMTFCGSTSRILFRSRPSSSSRSKPR